MFIDKLSKTEQDAIENDREPLYREESVVWASEGSVDLPMGITVGDCQRQLFYKFMGHEQSNKIPVRVRNICDSGLMYEDDIINKFKKEGLFVDEQVRMELHHDETRNKIISSGKMDILLLDEGIYRGIEVKTISTYKVNKVFGIKCQPLPAPKNLMQAMNYKYRSMNGPVLLNDGETEVQVSEVYLLYIDRGTGQRMYFEVDLDAELYPIITPIDQSGNRYDTIYLQKQLSFDDLYHHSSVATSDQARLAELRFSLNDVFKKYDTVYDYVREQQLPARDYSLIYNDYEVEREFQVGRLSKTKYNDHFKRHKPIGAVECTYCNYRDKCAKDDGIQLTD